MKRIYVLALLLWASMGVATYGQVIINEVRFGSNEQIELKNVGSTTIDVSNWWLCYRFVYRQLSAPNLTVTGNTNMMPGDIITITGVALNDVSSDLGLYNASAFGSSTAMQDFVQWGGAGIGREGVAASKGIWMAGTFTPVGSDASSIENDAMGNGAASWFVQESPTFGEENAILACEGGMVTAESGEDTVYVCIDGTDQFVSFASTGASGANFQYVVTDDQGNVLGLPPGNMVNFAPAGTGECWVFGLSYTGNLTLTGGENINKGALSDSCYSLSSNFLVVMRDSVSGGVVKTDAGADTAYVCIDGTDQFVSFASTEAVGPNFQYVVTDDQGNILGLPPGNMVNFAPAGTGECWVWGLSYSGELLAKMGDNATQVPLSSGCFDLSDGFLVVMRDSVSGGVVKTDAGADTAYVCIDGTDQFVSFASTEAVGPNFQYVVTDDQGNILGLPPGNTVNFAPAGTGECWVWGLSYSGELLAKPGDNATQVELASGCSDLSDGFLVVFRDSVPGISGGVVTTDAGADTAYVCIDGTDQLISFASTEAVGPNFQYVVTDDQGNILGLPPGNMVNFAPAGTGECWVWGLSYSGELLAKPGDNATQVELASGCADLSDGFLVVMRDSVSGGIVTPESGADTVFVCLDGSDQFVAFDSMGVVGPNFRYVVTDDAGNILGVPPGDAVNFGPAGPGECWVWGLAYSGDIIAGQGDNAAQVDLASGCFDLSDEFVVVLRDTSFCTTSIADQLTLTGVSIFPNPLATELNVRLENPVFVEENSVLSIFDLTGRRVIEQSISRFEASAGNLSLDVSGLKAGTYFILIQNSEGIFREQLLKR